MRKLFRFLTSRLFWTGIICIAQMVLLGLLIWAFTRSSAQVALIFYGVMELLAVFLMIYIISTKGNVAYKVSWLFFVGIIPMVGVFAYLIFGNKKLPKRKQKKFAPIISNLKSALYDTNCIDVIEKENEDAALMSRYILNHVGTPICDNTEATYFKLGDDAYPVMLEELKKAKHYIFFEYFILSRGKMLDTVLDILKQKAAEGLDVRVFYDDFGSITTVPSNLPKLLEKYNIKCVAYNRFRPVLDIKMNNRNHRKLLIIDGHTGFTGGINIADEYINQKVRFGHWKDNAIMIKGEAVWDMTVMFLSLWDYAADVNEDFNDFHYSRFATEQDHMPKSKGYVQPYCDYPFDDENVAENVYINLIARAKKYIYITTPYLLPSIEMQKALLNASKQGVKVTILTPHIPDKKYVFSATRSYYPILLQAGINIFEYTPGFVHAKMFVVDGIYGTVGTANLDYRSLFLNIECGVFLFDHPCIADMKQDFDDTIKLSQRWTMKDFKNVNIFKRFWWSILRLVAPLM